MSSATPDAFSELNERIGQISDLANATSVLGWDAQVYMPKGAGKNRGQLISTLTTLIHERATSDAMVAAFKKAEAEAQGMDPDSTEVLHLKVIRREIDKLLKVPAEFLAEQARVTVESQQVWEEAKANSDYPLFKPYLKKVIDLKKQYASFFAPYDHIYDPLLDEFEPELKIQEIQAIFAELKPVQVELVSSIMGKPRKDDSVLRKHYDEKKQIDFSTALLTQFGYDWNRARMDQSVHPFTTSFGIDDVRITTKVIPNWPSSCLFGTIHEMGHAFYQLGIDPSLDRTTLALNLSMAVHESQSRLWENIVGRSLPFWKFAFPMMQTYFPENLSAVGLQDFYHAINAVDRTFIRIEADEATYNLHIMLRLELELALLEGRLDVEQLPEAWNGLFKEYFGITPPNDAQGVLQDVHWSAGLFGYFPSYALGNLLSAMWWEKIRQDIPNIDGEFAEGKFSSLLDWLVEKIHRHGGKYSANELAKRITGESLNAKPYIKYLKEKYGEIYSL